ncbi:hypothetical protein SAMN04489867_3074 [Pedococcus dokdonensis]|uniref:Carboxypeptidase regulatory-like domain-containing protein n=1 Tax=Pedococcus dokdonensis TaxID=443156 RepID=A0A1H0U0X6_9MICO|nr:hypothetical protein [Pedococcus dokdonensis]SDP59824.1 hypothetical protein SAMN04489867_3074 [Pedococcus dokdonensis]
MTPEQEWEALAAELIDDQDLRTLSTLRSILQASDPVPSGLAERAKFAMSVAALEAEIAEITTTTAELAGVRSTDYDRAGTITFSSEQLSAMITIELVAGGDGGTARLSGWVTTGPTHIELRERSRTQETTTDDAGRFTFTSVQRGLVHLVMRRLDDPESRPVITPAIEI